MREIQAPKRLVIDESETSIFLAGSIEMGVADNWQNRVIAELKSICSLVILNPRRDDWDSSWNQSISDAKFREQVSWELSAMEIADVIGMYFDPKTKSPISLLELGLYSNVPKGASKLVVCCPEGFWRKGNVDIVCRRYGIVQVVDEIDFILTLKEKA